jgi:Ni/Co efflux regulator RcnB
MAPSPSMTRFVPVIIAAASLARNIAANATSRGRAKRAKALAVLGQHRHAALHAILGGPDRRGRVP